MTRHVRNASVAGHGDQTMKTRHQVLLIEDDPAEIATFRRLYEGDQFELTGLCIEFPRSVLPAPGEALGDRVPDLFVLDRFFPATSNPPGGFTPDTVDGARAQLARVLRVTEELEGMFLDESALGKSDKELLRAGGELGSARSWRTIARDEVRAGAGPSDELSKEERHGHAFENPECRSTASPARASPPRGRAEKR